MHELVKVRKKNTERKIRRQDREKEVRKMEKRREGGGEGELQDYPRLDEVAGGVSVS